MPNFGKSFKNSDNKPILYASPDPERSFKDSEFVNTNNVKSNEYENKTDYLNDSFGEIKDHTRDDLARATSLDGENEDPNPNL